MKSTTNIRLGLFCRRVGEKVKKKVFGEIQTGNRRAFRHILHLWFFFSFQLTFLFRWTSDKLEQMFKTFLLRQ
jgi:hypothetical protein